MRRLKIFLCLGSCLLVLAACSGQDELKKLKTYIASVKQRPKQAIEPIPQVKDYEKFAYNADERRSPFIPVSSRSASGAQPDLSRTKQALESFPLDSLRMVGTLMQGNRVWAIIAAPDGVAYRAAVGDYMGQHFGRVASISKGKISIIETIPQSGTWVKRDAAIVLQELKAS